MAKVAFLGLGVMGFPMAGYLARNGHEVTVYNRTRAKADAWVAKHGGKAADTPEAAAQGAAIVFSCVGDDPDLRAVTLGADGAFEGMAAGAIFVDHTTASANIARELFAAAAKKSIHFIDAPVSGGQAGAENGTLTVMCGGEAAPFETVKPVIAHFAKAVTLLGPSGSGQLTKMVNQICIAGLVEGLSEGINFALKAGLDAKQVLDVIGKGAAQSCKWTTAARPWSTTSSTLALPWTGCARTCASRWKSRRKTARHCRSRRSSTAITARSRKWAAIAGTPPA